jgi:hypothetical protein
MLRKSFAGILIIFSSILLGLSIAGVRLTWMIKEPLTQTLIARLASIDSGLGVAQTAIHTANLELEHTMSIIDSVENSLLTIKTEFEQIKKMFGDVNPTIGNSGSIAGNDFTETKHSMQNFLTVLQDYEKKLDAWRAQLAWLMKSLPDWIEVIAIGLTIFLFWFGFSQVSMINQGLLIWHNTINRSHSGGTPVNAHSFPDRESTSEHSVPKEY